MSIGIALATIAGGFLFPFTIRMMWGKMVDEWGAIGGWMAAAFIVGTVWTINHGIPKSMIYQSGTVWVDMAVAAGIGVFTASLLTGGKFSKSVVNLAAAVVGGVLGGFLLSLLL
ncbi:hypothetical protein HB970_12715 [Listeria welshimeri]|nr:hypothetical protein [Listeria welshimeri]